MLQHSVNQLQCNIKRQRPSSTVHTFYPSSVKKAFSSLHGIRLCGWLMTQLFLFSLTSLFCWIQIHCSMHSLVVSVMPRHTQWDISAVCHRLGPDDLPHTINNSGEWNQQSLLGYKSPSRATAVAATTTTTTTTTNFVFV